MFEVAEHVFEEDPLLVFAERQKESFFYRSKAGVDPLVRVQLLAHLCRQSSRIPNRPNCSKDNDRLQAP